MQANRARKNNPTKSRQRKKNAKTVLLCLLAGFIVLGLIALIIIFTVPPKPVNDPKQTTAQPSETDTPKENSAFSAGFETLDIELLQLYCGDLILVGGEFEYKALEEKKLLDIYSNRRKYDGGARAYQVSEIGLKLPDFVLSELNAMNEAFYEQSGKGGLLIRSAYRTRDEQQAIFNAAVNTVGQIKAEQTAAKPGYSEHETGLSFDMSVFEGGTNTSISKKPDYLPIYEMAYKYGFVNRYPANKAEITGVNYEDLHFRYVGMPHAYFMQSKNICLEEYLDLLRRQYTYSDVHLKVSAPDRDGNTRNFEIYFVPADKSKDTNRIFVPRGFEYTVSGNNVDGFIVTVDLDAPKNN